MAILRNREVELLGKTDGQDESPTYTVMYKDGERENVRLSDLQVTDEEFKNLTKAHGDLVMNNVNKIENKDLQELRDGQDRKKVEDRQGKQSADPVQVNKVMVDPTEVTAQTRQAPKTQNQPNKAR